MTERAATTRPTTPQQRGKASREKGKRGEREAARELMKRIPNVKIQRSVQYAGRMAAHSQGGMPDLMGLKGFHLEIKRTEKAKVYDWMEQVNGDKKPDEIGVILHRQSGKEWIAILSIDDLCKLINAAGLHRNKEETE